jgi:hypothetical protein
VRETPQGRPVDPDFGERVRGPADDVLDAEIRENASRIAALWATLGRARTLFEAETSKVVQAWLRALTLGLIESKQARGCNPEGGRGAALGPTGVPFASLRHALAVGRGIDADVALGAASLGSGGVCTARRSTGTAEVRAV